MERLFTSFCTLLLLKQVAANPNNVLPTATITTTKTEFSSAEGVSVTLNIENNNNRPTKVLKWLMPKGNGDDPEEDTLQDDLFSVTCNGQPAQYLGKVIKRPEPQQSDYRALPPGSSANLEVDLEQFYDMSGDCEITYSVASLQLTSPRAKAFGKKKKSQVLTSNTLTLTIEGGGRRTTSADDERLLKQTKKPNRNEETCDQEQKAILAQALNEAVKASEQGLAYLASSTQSTSRFKTWFGPLDNMGTVQNNFDSILDAMKTQNIVFNCKCKQPYYAYVYPNTPYEIFLCKVFWQVPLTGYNSKMGTLIHEMSHFNIVAGTDDHAYGAESCMALDPSEAIENADSHEYFAENPFNDRRLLRGGLEDVTV